MNNESNDNIVEDYMFRLVLKSDNINKEILKFHDDIIEENISIKDKKIILSQVIWNNINNTEPEIRLLIQEIRNDKFNKSWLYFLIFKILEKVLDINDDNSMKVFLNSKNEEISYELKRLTIEIIKNYKEIFIWKLKLNKSFSEILSNDYLDDNELKILVSELSSINNTILDNLEATIEEYNKKIKNTVDNEIDKMNKILKISAFPKN